MQTSETSAPAGPNLEEVVQRYVTSQQGDDRHALLDKVAEWGLEEQWQAAIQQAHSDVNPRLAELLHEIATKGTVPSETLRQVATLQTRMQRHAWAVGFALGSAIESRQWMNLAFGSGSVWSKEAYC